MPTAPPSLPRAEARGAAVMRKVQTVVPSGFPTAGVASFCFSIPTRAFASATANSNSNSATSPTSPPISSAAAQPSSRARANQRLARQARPASRPGPHLPASRRRYHLRLQLPPPQCRCDRPQAQPRRGYVADHRRSFAPMGRIQRPAAAESSSPERDHKMTGRTDMSNPRATHAPHSGGCETGSTVSRLLVALIRAAVQSWFAE
jgi:hypothetical protein